MSRRSISSEENNAPQKIPLTSSPLLGLSGSPNPNPHGHTTTSQISPGSSYQTRTLGKNGQPVTSTYSQGPTTYTHTQGPTITTNTYTQGPTTTYSSGVVQGQTYQGSLSVNGANRTETRRDSFNGSKSGLSSRYQSETTTTIGNITGKTFNNGVVQHYQGTPVVKESRVVGHERGIERLVSTTEHEMESVVHERIEHQRVRVPKKIVREEVIEKIYIVPETIQVEEWFEEEVEVEEKIIEIAKKVIIEKIVEVPEIEIIERIIEVPETIVREKVREVAKIETIERIVEVPVIQTVERCIDVPQIEYRDVPVQRIVEIPEVRTEEITREVAVPQYVDRPIERKVYVESTFHLERKIPVPIEAEQVVEYSLPNIVPRYTKKKFPVYLPRFVEVPISRQFASAQMVAAGEVFNQRVANLTTVQPAMSLCEIETLATEIKNTNFVAKHSESLNSQSVRERFVRAWEAQDTSVFGNSSSKVQNHQTSHAHATTGHTTYAHSTHAHSTHHAHSVHGTSTTSRQH